MTALDDASDLQTSSLSSTASTTKRKRSDNLDHSHINGNSSHQDHATSKASDSAKSSITTIFNVLSSHDTKSSILQRSLAESLSNDAPDAPDTKRRKISESHKSESVSEKVQKGLYANSSQLFADVESACSQALESLQKVQSLEGSFLHKYTPELVEADRSSADIYAFKRIVTNLKAQDKQEASVLPDARSAAPSSKFLNRPLVNGDVLHRDDTAQVEVSEVGGKKVLTLYGNAQGHKQLFSSSQQPFTTSQSSDVNSPQVNVHNAVKVPMPLREDKLPNQIYSTQIVATDTQDALPKARQSLKFGELFKPPSSLQSLVPPKHPKRSTSRGSEITWTKEDSNGCATKPGFTHERLPAGSWLGYNGISLSQDPISPEAKRKRRDRALSTGEPASDPSQNLKAVQAQAREDALFRGVYSSFAPCIDDAGALVPEEVRSEVWWHRYGESYLDPRSAVDPALEADQATTDDPEIVANGEEEQAFREVVENFDPAALEEATATDQKNVEKDADSVLRNISQLLESLLSFQRIRNATLRSNIGQSVSAQDMPAVPSADEVKLYEIAKTRLAGLVMKLPPFMIAKAGGQQLSDLLVSRRIFIEGKNYQGVMEEDQASRRAAGEALSNALGASTVARPAPGPRPSQTSVNRKPVTQGYNNARPQPPSQRQPLSSWQTPAQSNASSAQKPGYGQQPGQQAGYGRPVTSGYRPTAGTQANGVPTNYPQSPSQPQYQQRAQNTGQGWPGYSASSPHNRNPSPLQPNSLYQPSMQRPNGGYYNGPAAPTTIPLANMQSPRAPGRPPSTQQAHSPMGGTSPYAPPNTTRPMTPLTSAQAAMSPPAAGKGSPAKATASPLVNGT